MSGKPFLRNALSLLLMVTLVVVVGCEDEETPPQTTLERERIVEDGQYPVWLDRGEEQFLFSRSTQTGPALFIGNLDGSSEQIYSGAHNYDYVPSPNAARVALSTPELDGGLVVIDLVAGSSEMILEGARSPSWLNAEELVVQSVEGAIVRISAGGGEGEVLLASGLHPVASPDGSRVAYLYDSSDDGLDLRYFQVGVNEERLFSHYIGLDPVWHPDSGSIFASYMAGSGFQDPVTHVVRMVPGSDDIEFVLENAVNPSVSFDGRHLWANRVIDDQLIGVVHKRLGESGVDVANDAWHPAAFAEGAEALVEQADGIYRVRF